MIRSSVRAMAGLALLVASLACAACEAAESVDADSVRREVIALVAEGELAPGASVDMEVELPSSLRSASDGGRAVVLRDGPDFTVVLFDRRGVVDDWSGWVYSSTGELRDDPLAGGGPIQVSDLGEGWFYAVVQ